MNINIMKPTNSISRKWKVVIILLLLLTSMSVYATDIRGRIDFRARNGVFPMNGAFVQFCYLGGSCFSYRTGYDGMYYFRAPFGTYDILVNGRVVSRVVVPNQAYFDLTPLIGN